MRKNERDESENSKNVPHQIEMSASYFSHSVLVSWLPCQMACVLALASLSQLSSIRDQL